MAIFNIMYPPVVINYVSNSTLTSHESDCEAFNNNSPKDLLKAINPAENLQTKTNSVNGEKIPKSRSATPAPQTSIKTSKKIGKNEQRVIKHILSSSNALEEHFHLERYKEKEDIRPPSENY